MAAKDLIGRLADNAIKSLKDPVGTAGKVVEQAKGTAALGKMVAEQASRSAGAAVGKARSRSRTSTGAPRAESAPRRTESAQTVRSVPDVAPGAAPVAEPAETPAKRAADPLQEAADEAAKKTAAPAKKAAAKKAPAKKTARKKPAAKKAPAKKATTNKTATKKTAAKKTQPRTAEQLAADQGGDVTTPAGTPGVAEGTNPDTTEHDLDQPGTEQIMEDSTAKEVASESEMLRKAAERNPE